MDAHSDPHGETEESEEQTGDTTPHKPTDRFLRELQELLIRAFAVETTLWTFNTKDWAVSVHAADIDNDGDIEILIGSRDGYVRALTSWGVLKWETFLDGHYISAVFGLSHISTKQPTQPLTLQQSCVIVGTRAGKVLALDQRGKRVQLNALNEPEVYWEYDTGRMIRQLYVSATSPLQVIIGSEDRCVHILNRATGELVKKYPTHGWVRCVFSCDLDGDGNDEIIAGSGDKHIYILDQDGVFLHSYSAEHQIYAIFATSLDRKDQVDIITSSNRKDLTVWTLTRNGDAATEHERSWQAVRKWEKSPREGLFANRVHSICAAELNDDGFPEILVGSEDGHLYILDHNGDVLWKHNFGSCVYSICAVDINRDGQIEILAATENYGVQVLQVDLSSTNLYQAINKTYYKLCRQQSATEIAHKLSPKEHILLMDFVQELPSSQHPPMEMAHGIALMQQGNYKEALSIFLRLIQENVQYYWDEAAIVEGYIWTMGLCNLDGSQRKNIVVGTDKGYIYAFDSKQLWETSLGDRVRMIQADVTERQGYNDIVAVLANYRIVRLNNQGEKFADIEFEHKDDWARCLSIHRRDTATIGPADEILLGLENNRIAIYTTDLSREVASIPTDQGIGIVCTSDLTSDNKTEIISGSLNNEVYAHNREGLLLWRFRTEDRVQALRVADIDRDGYAEVIVGSEDRSIYVLDHEGKLKWRYLARRGVLDVDVCDIKMEFDSDNPEERTLKVLASSSDGYIYMLNANGDLVWKYNSNNRIRCVRAADINGDGRIEIIIASENRLEVLQIIDRNELLRYVEECWQALLKKDDYRGSILNLIADRDEYVHTYALVKLAGQHQRHPEDFRLFREALRHENSLQAKKELIRAVVVLCRVPSGSHDENTYQARQFLQQLSTDPDPEVRLEVVAILRALILTDEHLCFEYLEYFTHNIDPWVRRSVARQLDALVASYPERVFEMLLHMSQQDDNLWVLQEIGRVMAHYFDANPVYLIRDMLYILYTGSAPTLMSQISSSAQRSEVKHLYQMLVLLLQNLSRERLGAVLEQGLAVLRDVNALEPQYGEVLLQIYENFYQLSRVHDIKAILRHTPLTLRHTEEITTAPPTIRTILHVFDAFEKVIKIVRVFEKRESTGERMTKLMEAAEILDTTLNELRLEEVEIARKLVDKYRLPQYVILTFLLEQWHNTIKAEMFRLRGTAKLVAELENKRMRSTGVIDVSLRIDNKGRSPADNVLVRLVESAQFDILGPTVQVIDEISTNHPGKALFKLRPHMSVLHLSFKLTYDDAEKKDQCIAYADQLIVKGRERTYRYIKNPYTSGTPIRDNQHMFFGREDDLASLKEKLSSRDANKVVVLVGQRRMGKTSLIYHLVKELPSLGNYMPILIDVQSHSLDNNVSQLLEGFASRIQKELQEQRRIIIAEPVTAEFQANAAASFDRFLDTVLQAVPGYRLVLMFDEFEKLHEKVQQKQIDEGLLTYLRSLMQHHRDLNFLLAGAPDIRNIMEGYSSIFFNIGLYHNLKELKENEATALITEPVKDYLDYDPLALERMHYLTGNQPYLIHVMSEHVIEYCNKQHKTYATINDINVTLDTVLTEHKNSIAWIWGQSKAMERFILSILAQGPGEGRQIVSLTDIWQAFNDQNVYYDENVVMKVIKVLESAGFIEEGAAWTQFRITIGLLREWLRKDKPPKRVVQDEKLAFI